MVSANVRQAALCILSILLVPCVAQGQFYFPGQSATGAATASQGYSQLAPTTGAYGAPGRGYFAPPQTPRLSMNTDTAGNVPVPAQDPSAQAANGAPQAENGLAPYAAPYGASSGCNTGSSCDSCTTCAAPRCCPWYASVAGLVMGRNQPNGVWTTYETGNNPNQLMKTPNADPEWQGGGDVRIGRFFGCNRWAIEFGYWGIGNFSDTRSMTHPNTVSSPLLFQDLEFGVGNPVQDLFDVADEHRLTRRNELYNIELNLIQGYLPTMSCQNCTGRFLVGFRYFQFDEDLSLETLDQGGTWGGNGGLDQATLSDSVQNSLIGAQIGYMLERRIGSRFSAFITPKIGIYGNHIRNHGRLYRGDGTVATPTAFSNVSGSYPVNSTKDVVSFLTEVDLGLRYRLTEHWSLFGGYRVVVINGIGLSDNQIPQYIVDLPEVSAIDSNGSLVLQGGFFGAGYSF